MNLDEYERGGREAYAQLAATIADIIKMIVSGMPEIRMQQIQSRAKHPDSLRVKLSARNAAVEADIEREVKDLAGCRVIFYTNADVETFLQSRGMFENFDVDWDRTKFHYPQGDGSDQLFVARNYVVKLKDGRVALAEYAHLKGKWCEVQVQTTLNHAWSEMAHDTLYKPPAAGFGSKIMADVERRMNDLMNKYLRPAGFDFQKVVNDVRTYQRGRDLFDRDPLALLQASTSTNEISGLLDEFKHYVLPFYDDHAAVGAQVRTCLVSVIKKVRKLEAEPYRISGVDFPGKQPTETIARAISLLDYVRFLGEGGIEETFDALVELWPGAMGAEETKALVDTAKHLASHQMSAWRQVGPAIQGTVIDRILALPASERSALKRMIIPMLGEVLSTEIEGTSEGYNTITLHRGAVVPSKQLATMRHQAIDLLEEFYTASSDEAERKEIIDTLRTADSLPHSVTYGPELVIMALRDATRVIRFLTVNADTLSYELRQSVEHDILWLYRHRIGISKNWPESDELRAVENELLQSIEEFRSAANADRDFVVHKTLVGFESVFESSWNADPMDIEREQKNREDLIDQLVDTVVPEQFDYWAGMVRRCAQTKSNDLATFPSFGRFLSLVSKKQPDFGLRLLEEGDDDTIMFVVPIMTGLEGTAVAGHAKEILKGWVAEGHHLTEVAFYCGHTKPLDSELLSTVFDKAIVNNDIGAASNAVAAVGRSEPDRLSISQIFIPGIKFLAERENFSWIWNTWYLWRTQANLVAAFTEEEIDQVLASLIGFPRVDYRAEELLYAVAQRFPAKVIAYFGNRVRLDASDEAPAGYEEIPFDLHRVDEALRASPREIIEAVRQWFDEDDKLFEYRGGRFVSRVFPEIGPVEDHLRALVRSGRERDIAFVLSILQGYSGEDFLIPLSLDIVDVLEPDDKRLVLVGIVLDATGVVTGEFGLVEAYRAKKEALAIWGKDPREKVATFVGRHLRELDNQIAAERQRSEEGVELRKRDYPETGV